MNKGTSYYIITNNEKKGAFTFEELIENELSSETLVWKEGLKDWIKAREIDELKNYLVSQPPLTPLEKKKLVRKSRFQYVFKNQIRYAVIIFVVLTVVFNLIYWDIAKEGGSSANPIYLFNAEQENSFLLFMNLLPASALMCGVISILFLLFRAANYQYNDTKHELPKSKNISTTDKIDSYTNLEPLEKRILESEVFSQEIFPDIKQTVDKISEAFKPYKNPINSSMVISYAKDHKINNEWKDSNKEVYDLIVLEKIPIKTIEYFFSKTKKDSTLRLSYEKFLKNQIE